MRRMLHVECMPHMRHSHIISVGKYGDHLADEGIAGRIMIK
jgi:hypothetical protein